MRPARSAPVEPFDPAKAKLRDAKYDAVIALAKQMKDWPLLEQAVEAKMKELEMDLTLPKEVRVIRIPVEQNIAPPPMTEFELQPFSEGLLNFFGRWVKVAQAKTEP